MRPPLLDLRSAAPLPPPRHWPRPRRRRLADMNCCRCSSALGEDPAGAITGGPARSDGDVTARDFFYESAQIHRKFDQTAREFYRTSWKSSQTALEIRMDRQEIPADCAGNSTRPAGNSSRSGAGFSQPTLEMSPTPAGFCLSPHFPGGLYSADVPAWLLSKQPGYWRAAPAGL